MLCLVCSGSDSLVCHSPDWGSGGPGFESQRPDHYSILQGQATPVIPRSFCDIISLRRGGVSERFMETVLKTVLVLMASVGSNPTPSANLNPNQT